MAESKCLLCDEDFGEEKTTTVREKGIQTLIQSSKERKDNNHIILKRKSSVTVHEKCRLAYNKKCNIDSALTQQFDAKQTRSGAVVFDFKKMCLFCGEAADDTFIKQELKKAISKRDKVHRVMTKEFYNKVVETAQKQENDEVAKKVLFHITNVSHDLIALKARYHGSCAKTFFNKWVPIHGSSGRPEVDNITKAVQYISNFMEENEEQCQFTLPDMLKHYTGYIPPDKTIIARLIKMYGEDIIIKTAENQYKQTIICFKNTDHAILNDKWYESRCGDALEERLRIVKAAAAIIRQDIRSQVYNLNSYPKPDSFLSNVDNDVPPSLNVLLESIISPKRATDKIKTKTTSIAHAIITATRPRSFHSPIQIGLGSMLYKKYGSRDLLKVLSALGACSSYNDVRLFEVSCLKESVIKMQPCSLTQFVFDNADVNIDTLDGMNTFHAMGGIQVTTPKPLVSLSTEIKKVPKIPNASSIAGLGKIPVVPFHKTAKAGLSKITIQEVHGQLHIASEALQLLPNDFLWLYGKWKGLENMPGWNGFMETLTCEMIFTNSDILCLPFIHAPPSNYDTIYSALLMAAEKSNALGQQNCFVTFDQPLYIKARDIVAGDRPELTSIIVRLGGFHLIMSFMGAIGFIMDGSGLQELFGEAYASASVIKMMTGHAYSRALRAHILAHLALTKVILAMIETTEQEERSALEFLVNFKSLSKLQDTNVPEMTSLLRKFNDKLDYLENKGATAKLWVSYYKMVTIMKNFVAAEKSGNWSLHLQCIKDMIPYFHSSGHFLYAKSSHLYLQDMMELKSHLTPYQYDQYVNNGYFTIRRTDKFWSGIWSDMTIEQTLMRSLKSTGGLTRGRGLTDSTLAKWISTMPIIMDISQQVEKFCGVSFCTTEQHVDSRASRIKRDDSDGDKFVAWFMAHNPFPSSDYVMCLSTGVISDEKINCHLANEIGAASIKSIIGSNFGQVKFKRTNRVIPMKNFMCTVKIHDEEVPVNPETIFRRISFHKKSEEELRKFFEFELAPYPTSLFDDLGMRKTRKSVFFSLFTPLEKFDQIINPVHVVDGGFLLHRVMWELREKFSLILAKYVEYVRKNYGAAATIVFDGYPEESSEHGTKSAERFRRKNKYLAASVDFDETMSLTMSKEHFLANEGNKRRLIKMLIEKLEENNFAVKQSTEDADTDIVMEATQLAQQSQCVIIVGEDIDLLVLLTAFAPNTSSILFLKPGKGQLSNILYSPLSFKYSSTVKSNILFLHAFSGCDSTSAIFRQGKMKFVKLLEKHSHLQNVANVFNNQHSTQHEVCAAGQKFFATLYNDQYNEATTLHTMRYEVFAKSLLKTQFNLASLPPTEDAAKQHSLRVFHQINLWKGQRMNPTKWGWRLSKHGILPITMSGQAAPSELLNTISCKCAKGCKGGCSCRKNGIKCTTICYHCKGASCTNTVEVEDSQTSYDAQVDMEEEEFNEEEEQAPPKKRSKI